MPGTISDSVFLALRLARPAELELHLMMMSPGIERLGNELAAIVDLDRLWQAGLLQALQHRHHALPVQRKIAFDRGTNSTKVID